MVMIMPIIKANELQSDLMRIVNPSASSSKYLVLSGNTLSKTDNINLASPAKKILEFISLESNRAQYIDFSKLLENSTLEHKSIISIQESTIIPQFLKNTILKITNAFDSLFIGSTIRNQHSEAMAKIIEKPINDQENTSLKLDILKSKKISEDLKNQKTSSEVKRTEAVLNHKFNQIIEDYILDATN